MKKEFGFGWLLGYIFLAFFCCFMSFQIAILIFNQEVWGFIFEIPTMGAFVIGAVYLYSGDSNAESDKEEEEKDN